MKKIYLGFIAVFFLFVSHIHAADKIRLTDEELDYAEIVKTIKSVREPYLNGNYVIFTAESNVRHIGIAFDFEGYKTIHSYKEKVFHDEEYNACGSLYFFITELPKNVLSFNYRLIIEGLWTTDPMNPETIYNRETNLTLSHFDATREIAPVTEKTANGKIRFIYRGKTGQQIRLGGSFTNWDSWIYQMEEIKPGLYQFELPLTPGKYEYAFYTGITSFPDRTNPQRCYTNDGKTASLLIVE